MSSKFWIGAWAAILFLGVAAFARASRHQTDQPVSPDLDLPRYMGRWYEISAIPHWFERGCADTTADYTLRPDGRVNVLNTCLRGNEKIKAKAVAWRPSQNNPAKLKVMFFWPFRADYWVLAHDPEYQWAVVGHPSRRYLWILSRQPTMPPVLYQALIKQIVERGYDPALLRLTPQ